SGDDTLKVWDAATGQTVRTLQGHRSFVSAVAFSPDGTRIGSGSYDRTLKIWDAATGQEVRTLQGHTSPVSSVAFHPDGKRPASPAGRGRVLAWPPAPGPPPPPPGAVTASPGRSAASPDGRLLVRLDGNRLLVETPAARQQQQQRDQAILQRWAAFDPAWHLSQIQTAQKEGNTFAAAFHLSWMLRHRPNDASPHVRLAHQLGDG